MIKLGQIVRYNPFDGVRCPGCTDITTFVNGTVMYINQQHRWFQAVDEYGLKTSFKFDDANNKFRFV